MRKGWSLERPRGRCVRPCHAHRDRLVPAIGVRLATFIHSQFSANTKQYGKHPATACRHTRKASRSSRHKMGSRQSAERNTSIGLAGGWTHQQRRERRVVVSCAKRVVMKQDFNGDRPHRAERRVDEAFRSRRFRSDAEYRKWGISPMLRRCSGRPQRARSAHSPTAW